MPGAARDREWIKFCSAKTERLWSLSSPDEGEGVWESLEMGV